MTSTVKMTDLEALAQAFQETMHERKLVGTKKYHFKSYTNVFLGTDAVTVLKELLQNRNGEKRKVDRNEAVQVGREIASKYQLYCHSHNDHELKDEKLFYRFQNNLPHQVAEATQGKSLREKMKLFEENVDVRDRTYHLRTYSQCFVAREAVDVLMNLKLVICRQGAVELVREMNQRFYLCEHVCRDHDFKDEYLFFRFIPSEQRMLDTNDEGQTLMAMLDAMVVDEESSSLDEPPMAADITVRHSLDIADLLPPGKTLKNVAEALERNLEVKDRRYRFTDFKSCFIAEDAVSYMVKTNLASSRTKAELLGRQLELQLNLFHHVTNDHLFRDKGYFFRFTPLAERRDPDGLSQQQKPDELFKSKLRASWGWGRKGKMTKQGIMNTLRESKVSLAAIAKAFEEGVQVKNLVYRLKTFEDVFTGKSAVSFLVRRGFAADRREAVLLGKLLAENYHLFEHVTREHELVDDNFFYRFVTAEKRRERQVKEGPKEKEVRDTVEEGLAYDENQAPDKDWHKSLDPELIEVYSLFRQGVKVKNNRYRGKLYRNTFIGSQAVDFMVNASLAPCRKEAVQLGRRLMSETKKFRHVTSDWDFADDYKFYQFEEDRETSRVEHRFQSITSSFCSSTDIDLRNSTAALPDLRKSTSSFLSDDFLPLEKIAEDFITNVKVQDRRYLFKTYRNCFVGMEAVDYLVGKTKWAESRREAVQIGQTLMRELDLFSHVTNDHTFKDEVLFYQFTDADKESFLRRVEVSPTLSQDVTAQFSSSRLINAARKLEEGLHPTINRYHLRVYTDTIIGSGIVTFLVDSDLASSRVEALQLGRAVAKQFQLFEHVTLEHLLEDQRLFYRFVKRSNRSKGQWFANKYGVKLKIKMLSVAAENLTTAEYWDFLLDIIEKDTWELERKRDSVKIQEFEIVSEDTVWIQRVKTFECRVFKSILESRRFAGIVLPKSLSESQRLQSWLATFLRLDPRFQIYHFFNEIALAGGDFVAEDPASISRCSRPKTLNDIRPLFRFLPVDLAQVFTVWRPTSFDAIRKLMKGEAIGKGLDIKGKSAKRGKLSGFVPCLQISNNKDKNKIRRLSRDSKVRVFYGANGRRARDNAAIELENVLEDMLQTVEEAKKILASDSADPESHQDALECMLLDMADPYITPIDEYALESFGLEIPERLFWEAYFVRQDCTRKHGSIYDTGRPSHPAFQDMNFAALRAEPAVGAPKAVVYQNADRDDPMNPFELLMAYEEHGRILPVVSDFDCFLVGTRRVHYTRPLPTDQLEILRWCIEKIEKVTQKMVADYKFGKIQKPWSIMWLETLKEASNEGFHPEIPRLGFGDPQSYAIMEEAVDRLRTTGAVRHGSECFNYYFPQDLDDTYLVISKGIGEEGVPWKYVDEAELVDFLSSKADEGFTFPLNPKWILMDGWKCLYDKLLSSCNEDVKASMNVWFPPESGIREQIERIAETQEHYKKVQCNAKKFQDPRNNQKAEVMYFT